MEATPVDGWPRYLTPSIALFEVVKDDLLPIRPIGIQVAEHVADVRWSTVTGDRIK